MEVFAQFNPNFMKIDLKKLAEGLGDVARGFKKFRAVVLSLENHGGPVVGGDVEIPDLSVCGEFPAPNGPESPRSTDSENGMIEPEAMEDWLLSIHSRWPTHHALVVAETVIGKK